MKKYGFLIALCCVLLLPVYAHAVTFGFSQITSNGNEFVASQLSVDVTDAGNGQVLFTISNSGPIDSVIDAVYFDDGTLLGIASITNTPLTVVFSQFEVSPANLPGGNTVDFETTAGFSADADSPSPKKGVSPGESLGILFNLINGQTYADTLAALAQGIDIVGGMDGLRIGLHVQAIGSIDGSESFVNNPPNTQVPEPMSLLLLGLGLIGVVGVRRKL